jgi:two-component system chemotaxis sensor kinase CheA
MINDPSLLELFAAESQDHLAQLDAALLSLERSPGSAPPFTDMLRATHSLKGAARVIGLIEIESLAHRFEDVLVACQRGEVRIEEQFDRLNRGLQSLGALAKEACSGQGSQLVLDAELAALTLPTLPILSTATGSIAAPPVASAPPVLQTEANSAFRIESVRVQTDKLDALLKYSGELRVNRGSIARRFEDIAHIVDGVDEFRRQRKEARWREGAGDPESEPWIASLSSQLGAVHRGLQQDRDRLTQITDALSERIRDMRLLPLQSLFSLFPRMVHELAKEKGKRAELLIEGGEISADKRILEEIKDPLTHLLRNAIDHGIELPAQRQAAGKPAVAILRLTATQSRSRIRITVSDDGAGLDTDAIAKSALKHKLQSERELADMSAAQIHLLLLHPSGLSTSRFVTETSGRGIGMGVVRANLERLKAQISFDSRPGLGLAVRLDIPITLATARVLLVRTGGQDFALPADHVRSALFIERERIFTIEGRQVIHVPTQVLPVAALHDLLELGSDKVLPSILKQSKLACVIIEAGDQALGLLVDEMVGEEEVMLHQQCKLLQRVRHVSGVTIRDTGDTCAVLNPLDLIKSASLAIGSGRNTIPKQTNEPAARRCVLLAEDSITTRTQEKRILEAAGFAVTTAVDGSEAFLKLGSAKFDALISDIQMPNMDGLQLTRKVRTDKRYAELPIILVTTLGTDEDKKRGMEAGANAYITKSAFDQQVLIECLNRLI